MNTLSPDQIIQNSSFETLLAVFGHMAKVLISRAGDLGDLADLPVLDTESGEVVGWLRSVRNEIARMEARSDFRMGLATAADSITLDIADSDLLRPIPRPTR